MSTTADDHPFLLRPHRTFVGLSLPVLLSLVAEPLTGLIDTAFVARLGDDALAGLGVSTALLAGTFWVFNFLSIGTQSEVAAALGREERGGLARSAGTATALSTAIGVALAVLLYPALATLTALFGAEGSVQATAMEYLGIRLIGAPAILVTHALFGAFRGLQDMRTPLLVAVAANATNILLDATLIHGVGPIPAFGIAGAAWASTIAQALAAGAALWVFNRRHGLQPPRALRNTLRLFTVGRDLFARTGMLLLFMMYSTRVANLISTEAGAAHQAVRTVWIFTAFLLDAYATTAQSLVGYFLGSGDLAHGRRVARLACAWGFATGILTSLAMLASTDLVSRALIGTPATPTFAAAWQVAALAQPINAISFVTDGIHWGTGDYRYLRNVMLLASGCGLAALIAIERSAAPTLLQVWLAIAGWITVRASFGFGRIWPSVSGPLAPR